MIAAILLTLGFVYLGACLLAGFGDPPPLAEFSPDSRPLVRSFAGPASGVMAAYRTAAGAVPGMRAVEERPGVLLVDARPTSRVLNGNFGMAIRVRFTDQGRACQAIAEAMNKARFALGVNHDAAFAEAERALRMAAKRHGLREVVAGPTEGRRG